MEWITKKNKESVKNSDKAMGICLMISVLVITLYFIPYGDRVLYPFMLLYTFIHEMGHGIAAEIVGEDFVKFEMWADGSGVTTNNIPKDVSRLKLAFIAFGGLIAPTIIAAVSFVLGRSGRASRIGMGVFGAICVASIILFVRNSFGFIFVLACTLISFLVAIAPRYSKIPQYSMLIIAITLLTAVFSRADYLFTDSTQIGDGTMPSDVGQIAQNLFLPYWFWGGLITVLSVLILVLGIRRFFQGMGATPEKKKSSAAE